MAEDFISNYTMEQLRKDSEQINHPKMNRRYNALVRLARIKNGRIWKEAPKRNGGFW